MVCLFAGINKYNAGTSKLKRERKKYTISYKLLINTDLWITQRYLCSGVLEVNNFKTNLMCVQVGNVHIELIIVIDFDKNLHKVIPVLIWDVGNDGHIWINQIGWEYSPSPLFLASCRSLQVNSKRILLEDCLTKISSILGTYNIMHIYKRKKPKHEK